VTKVINKLITIVLASGCSTVVEHLPQSQGFVSRPWWSKGPKSFIQLYPNRVSV
jgi:hypothetical protein